MTGGNFFRRAVYVLLIVSITVFTAIGCSDGNGVYTATAEYSALEFESQDVAKLRASDKAIHDATKQLGVKLKERFASNSNSTYDDILVIASNGWQLVGEPKYSSEVVKQPDGTTMTVWKATVNIKIDDHGVKDWFYKSFYYRYRSISQTLEAQEAYEKNERKIENLKEKYTRATSQDEKDTIIKQINDADNEFLANYKIEEGNKLYYSQSYDEAIEMYNESLEIVQSAAAYNNIGLAHDYKLQHDQSVLYYDKAIELNPQYVDAYNNRGEVYAGLGQNDKAIEDFNKAVELNPKDYRAYYNLGYIYDGLEQKELSIKNYNKTVELNPINHDAYYNLGKDYADLKQYEQAIEAFSKFLEIQPKDFGMKDDFGYNNRGKAYIALGEYDKAIQDFNEVIKQYPDDCYDAYYNLGCAYSDLGQYEKAIDSFTMAVEVHSKYFENFVDVYYPRGNAYYELKQYDQAIKDYEKFLELRFYDEESYEKIMDAFNKVIAHNPNDEVAYLNVGKAHFNSEQYEQAIQAFNKAIELNPNDKEAYYYLGKTYSESEQYEVAIQYFNKAIEIDSEYFEAYYVRGFIYQRLNQYEKAIQDYNKALEFKTEESIYNYRGLAYFELGEYEKALQDFDAALEIYPYYEDAKNNREACLQAMGK